MWFNWIKIPVIGVSAHRLARRKIVDPWLLFPVENQKVMLGTYSPQAEPYTYEAEEDTTPSGIFARGSYTAKLKVKETTKENVIYLHF